MMKPGYKQTEVGVIPEEWEVRPFLSTVRIANGQVSPKIEPYKSMTLVAPDHIESSTGKLLAKQTAAEQRAISGKYRFERGDIVYSKIRPYLRKAILAEFSGLCSADMYPLKPATDISSGFIFATILGYRFSKYAESVSVRSGMPKINRTELAAYCLAVPSTPEQCAIAEALSDVDGLLGALDRLIAKKRDIKQAAMQQLLTGQTRLPGFEVKPGYKHTEVGVIPEDWAVPKLDSILDEISMGPFGSDITVSNFISTGVPVLNGSNVASEKLRDSFENYVSFSKAKSLKKAVAFRGDIVVTHRGTIGQISYIPDDSAFDRYVVSQSQFRARVSKNTAIPVWIVLYFHSDLGSNRLLDGKGHTGVPAIAQPTKTFRNLSIPLPPLPEQTAIAEVLSDMDAELAALEQRREKTRALKQGMMQELLTGRTRLID